MIDSPPFGNLAIQLFKLTALVSFIGISDLTYTAYQLNQDDLPHG